MLDHKSMNPFGKYQSLPTVIAFGVVYLIVGVAFPNPLASNKLQFIWRLGAWSICAVAFAIHIWLEHFRLRNSPRRTALHASLAVALGALGLAIAANIHAMRTGTGNPRLLALALVIWPIITGVPAFIVAFVAAAALLRIRPKV
jgi:hypothetical protein